MKRYTGFRWIMGLAMGLQLLCGICQAQDGISIPRNAVKLDLIGVPLAFVLLEEQPYPRVSLEYQRNMYENLSLIIDGEIMQFDERFYGRIGDVIAFGGNRQEVYSLLLGFRFLPMAAKNPHYKEFLFFEPRLSISYNHSELTPFTIEGVVVSKNRLSFWPRGRMGSSILVTDHLGLELSGDLAVLRRLGSNKIHLFAIPELSFMVRF